jgi:hypothetical protein
VPTWWATRLRRLCAQHHALWDGPWAGANLGGCEGRPRCSSIALTPGRAVTYANTWRLPPQRLHANTCSSNVLRSNPAQVSCCGLLLECSIAPFWEAAACAWLAWGPGCSCCPGRTQGPSFAPGANTPWYLVRFTRGGGIKPAIGRISSNPVKYKCVCRPVAPASSSRQCSHLPPGSSAPAPARHALRSGTAAPTPACRGRPAWRTWESCWARLEAEQAQACGSEQVLRSRSTFLASTTRAWPLVPSCTLATSFMSGVSR